MELDGYVVLDEYSFSLMRSFDIPAEPLNNMNALTDAELKAYGNQCAINVLEALLQQTCNNCKGKDVRESMEAKIRQLQTEIDAIDGKVN